ncbi:lipolytic protein G-D-S-L family [Chitinophaga silvatica]|uniref:Lipolytic protein G-D-S-L family n=2 Tax=Chitinophaga silvatica TaxID=2282649 RepID=A0A3E1Y3Z1_9BACT|nr:lipolytic protein G-D-S-L family [Chitinophaga silvatica]
MAIGQTKQVNIVFIGNSITRGAGLQHPKEEAPPVKAVEWLRSKLKATIAFSNQGVSGSTTLDFLPSVNRLFNNVVTAANEFNGNTQALLVFSMVLGTNDSAIEGPNGSPVSSAQYEKNIKAIIDSLLALYPKCIIVLHHPIWYSPNTQNSSRYLGAGLARLQTYFPILDKMPKTYPGKVYVGYTQGFKFFSKHPELFIQEQGAQGIFQLHPNADGAAKLGTDWGKAIQIILKTKGIN